jgi:hypothetical protein
VNTKPLLYRVSFFRPLYFAFHSFFVSKHLVPASQNVEVNEEQEQEIVLGLRCCKD